VFEFLMPLTFANYDAIQGKVIDKHLGNLRFVGQRKGTFWNFADQHEGNKTYFLIF
jgi:hypothetical protein